MLDGLTVKVIIPALDEAASIGNVLADVPSWVDEVVVVDNGSTDETAAIAAAAGARVVDEPRRGYGQACLAGMAAIDWCDVAVFLDGDYSDFPKQMDRLVRPIAEDRADMVLGRRIAIHGDAQAFTLPQRFGTGLACLLMRIFWRGQYRDMGPFRAIRWNSLRALRMRDTTYGWTIEMQIKALVAELRVLEAPVDYRRRIGASKISGTIRGVWGAGTKILGMIGKCLLCPPRLPKGQSEKLIVFSRWPTPGKTKTRLIPALGPLGAAELQRRMTVRTLGAARQWASGNQREVEVRHEGGSWRQMRRWLGPGLGYQRQLPGSLGHRMASALTAAFDAGCRRAVLIGTDSPSITPALLDEAILALDNHDLVVGPTFDGGYWLIGMTRLLPVFDGIAWSTETVLSETLDLATKNGWRVHLLSPMADIDRPEDLALTREFFDPDKPVLSVVIPTLNEANNIEATIRSATAVGVEIIVADGGSSDNTPELARKLGARVIHGPPGRARQQNAGAVVANSETLLFLHADTLLSAYWHHDVFESLLDPLATGGGFLWRTDMDGLYMQAARFFVRLRTVYGQEPWGDQAIFVRRAGFHAVGGFPDVPIAEDWNFVRAMRQYGTLVTIPKDVITSARRWKSIGVTRGFITNRLIIIGCYIGLPRELLAQLY
ncbi:hypothetical protein LCGC14_0253760 [marine sediment metagenome]|uniref:Glycosyltransferase 2-like domain-containing protein n=1 Tax=marine sediment metagenome TaxID=412755 RepID=A0A0F9U3P4_9ZZZZ|nr:DUF2064 domain-containing protein [Phycisphaerae bacterium]HDZ45185.1 DUF2064 domain-containing protein [Phycisphaerae bacterium]